MLERAEKLLQLIQFLMRTDKFTKNNNTSFLLFSIFFKQFVQYPYGFYFTVVSSHWNAEKEKKGKKLGKAGKTEL